jgi:hypothetical protein
MERRSFLAIWEQRTDVPQMADQVSEHGAAEEFARDMYSSNLLRADEGDKRGGESK